MITFTMTDPELAALAAELMNDNPYMLEFEAVNRAGEMLDDMESYAARWDNCPCLPISLIETLAA